MGTGGLSGEPPDIDVEQSGDHIGLLLTEHRMGRSYFPDRTVPLAELGGLHREERVVSSNKPGEAGKAILAEELRQLLRPLVEISDACEFFFPTPLETSKILSRKSACGV